MIIKRVDRQMADWFQWYERLITIYGAPGHSYNFDKIRSMQPHKCIVPLADIPRRLVEVDRAMREIDPRLWSILWLRHAVPGTEAEKCDEYGFSKSWYRKMVGLSHKWIEQMGG